MIITINPKIDIIWKPIPTNLKPNSKKKGPNAQNSKIKPTIIAIIPPIPLNIFTSIVFINSSNHILSQ